MSVNLFLSTDPGAPVLNGIAGSLITVLDACLVNGYGSKSGAGWLKSFSGTNKAAYRSASGNRQYLRILDDGSATNGGRQALGIGYDSMTSIDSGTNPFPASNTINSSGSYWTKSFSATADSVRWLIAADERMFYLFVEPNVSYQGRFILLFFGEALPRKNGLTPPSIISNERSSIVSGDPSGTCSALRLTSADAPNIAGYSSKSYTGATSAAVFFTTTGFCYVQGTNSGCGFGYLVSPIPFPDPVTGGITVGTVLIGEARVPVAILPGILNPLHNHPLTHLDVISIDQGGDAKNWTAIDVIGNAYNGSFGQGQILIDATGPWR